MRVLAIDYGTKRIGLALSDETQTLAREYKILSPSEFWEQISLIISEELVGRVVIGLPLNMSGESTEKTDEAREFADTLKVKVSVPIEMVDERLSSVMAAEITGSDKNIDSLAAQIFLQNYLNKNKQV